jgi:hypothetical protein
MVVEAESCFEPQTVAGTEPYQHDIAVCEQLLDELNSAISRNR